MTPPASAWQPGASPEALKERARMLSRIRAFFAGRGVLEVETPLLCSAGSTDPQIESFSFETSGRRLFLSTSPEFAMKRLLAAGSGAIYQITRAFRREEAGRLHNPEFTLVEWYRPSYDIVRLMDEVAGLVADALGSRLSLERVHRLSYQEAFMQRLGLDPLSVGIAECAACAETQGLIVHGDLEKDAWLDLLLSEVVSTSFDPAALTFIYDYPASQAALARLKPDDARVAERFELFFGGLELANGFHELGDAREQRQRFEADNRVRRARGQAEVVIDERLLLALDAGLPDCAGVALGLDRLLMIALDTTSLAGVLAFPAERA